MDKAGYARRPFMDAQKDHGCVRRPRSQLREKLRGMATAVWEGYSCARRLRLREKATVEWKGHGCVKGQLRKKIVKSRKV